MSDECCICFEQTKHKMIPCRHHVCQKCFKELWKRKNTLCPMCKQVVCKNSDAETFVEKKKSKHIKCILFNSGMKAGITIRDTTDGVLISNINKSDACYMNGLRKGSIITHVNELSCNVGHEKVCKIFELASQKGLQLECTIRPSKSIQFLTSLMWKRMGVL